LVAQPTRLDDLQNQCVEWWRGFKKGFSQDVGEFLAARSADPEPMGELATKWGTTPAWRLIELLRHHDTRALARRIHKQAVRLATTGKFRAAYRRGSGNAD
jgi:hypothetical protein